MPGMPSKSRVNVSGPSTSTDGIVTMRWVRKNGYVFCYANNCFTGQFAYAVAATTVDIYASWYQAQVESDKWLEYLTIGPREAVIQ